MLKIRDKVKYYFEISPGWVTVHTGIIFIIHESIVFPDKLSYGVIRDSNKFHDFGYKEDFKKVYNGNK